MLIGNIYIMYYRIVEIIICLLEKMIFMYLYEIIIFFFNWIVLIKF